MQEQELVNAIAKLVVEQLKNVDVCDPKDRIPVGISARHVHLSQADLETLFGKGYELVEVTGLELYTMLLVIKNIAVYCYIFCFVTYFFYYFIHLRKKVCTFSVYFLVHQSIKDFL